MSFLGGDREQSLRRTQIPTLSFLLTLLLLIFSSLIVQPRFRNTEGDGLGQEMFQIDRWGLGREDRQRRPAGSRWKRNWSESSFFVLFLLFLSSILFQK